MFTLVQGNPDMLDHTPATPVASGQAVVIGDAVRIAHLDIEAGRMGALAGGGGVYDGTLKAGDVIADGAPVFLDGQEAAAAGAQKLGVCVGGAASGAATVRFQHVTDPARDGAADA